jgi:Tol biopolymer transport system component
MSLSPGTRLGPYEILSPLGAGGMGEVYKAKDTRLGREVAVKVLPASYSADADRLRRFEQEARTAGLLKHPNILAIYDIGVHDSSPFIVSELLEGETLRARLSGGALSVRKAVDYATQTAHGLAAAHAKGIIHRDLKPENLFLTADGRIKILDFGLAKLTSRGGAESSLTEAPTMPAETDPGSVLGTVGYMSPEQVRGKAADARSDLFAFGAILYEMLSGKRAFHKDTAAETMTAILKEEPPELSETNRSLPPGLERIVRHCLEKSPEERFQSAGDVAFDLQAISAASGSVVGLAGGAAAGRLLRLRPAPWILGVVALVAAAYFLGRKGGFTAGEREVRGHPPRFQRLSFRRGEVWSARFASDGQTIVYGAAWEGEPIRVFSTRSDSTESRLLDLPPADVLAISGSGEMAISLSRRYAAGFESTGTLARAPLAGGAPRELMEQVQDADWGPDGLSLAVSRISGGQGVLEFPIGHVLYRCAGWIGSVRVSPRGDRIAFSEHPSRGDSAGRISVVDLAGKRTFISEPMNALGGLVWAPGGTEIWFSGAKTGNTGQIHAATLDGNDRIIYRSAGSLDLQDISREGRVLLTLQDVRREVVGIFPGESRERNLSWFDWSFPVGLSADGRLLLFSEQGAASGANYLVYLRKTDGSPAVRLGEGAGVDLSPDGRWALAFLGGSAESKVVLLPTGAGEPRTVASVPLVVQWGAWFPDGKRVLLTGSQPGHAARLYVLPVSGGPARPVTGEGVGVVGNTISPDGKTIAARSPDGKLCLYPVDGGEPSVVAGAVTGDFVSSWMSDGKGLYVWDLSRMPAPVLRLDIETGKRQLLRELSPPDPAGVGQIGPVLMTPDGRSIAYSYRRLLSDLYVVEGMK